MLHSLGISPPGAWGRQRPPAGTVVDRTHPLLSDAVEYWPGIEAGGQVLADLLGGGAFVLTGAEWRNTPNGWRVPYFGDSASGAHSQGVLFTAWTLLVWIRFTSNSNSAVLTGDFSLSWYGSGVQWMIYSSDYSENISVFSSELTSNVWYCLAMTRSESSEIKAWKNGVCTSSSYGADPVKSLSAIKGFRGHLGPLCTYRRVLSASEMRQHYEQPFCMFASGHEQAALADSAKTLLDGSLASETSLLGAVA